MAESDGEMDYEQLVAAQNRKHKKAGGFQSFGLDQNVFKAILKKGYKVPTPIQRKAIPLLLDGKDVVAMARTGSGKTAAFLLPMFQKLKCRNAKSGVRGLLISPTRELALQTFKFMKELGKYTGLRATVLVGGDAMEEQFSAIHENPDVIIATPGRLLHVVVEMNLKLKSVEYVVFDEADRLFEIGFEEQLLDVLKRLPDNRQTSLFSATLPKSLIDFAKAGLNQPTLIRLDVESKLSDQLKTSFIFCRSDDKLAVLLHLLRSVVESDQQSIIFAATKHHIEYLRELLERANIDCSYIYSSLDSFARRQQIESFRRRNTNILLSTDLAARGVDIPLLDVTINFHFPAKAKLFIHRVGRVARAGRSGQAYSIVSPEEMPFVVDLFLFLGRSIKILRSGDKDDADTEAIGSVPQSIIDAEEELIRAYHGVSSELESLKPVAAKAYGQYIRSRPQPSAESVKRVKSECMLTNVAYHPIFTKGGKSQDEGFNQQLESKHVAMLDGLKNYKPQLTVFELGTSNKHETWRIMKAKRAIHEKRPSEKRDVLKVDAVPESSGSGKNQEQAGEEDIQDAFSEVIDSNFRLRNVKEKDKPKSPKPKETQKKKKAVNEKPATEKSSKDMKKNGKEYFIPYRPSDFHSERGLAMEKSGFEKEAEAAVLDLTGDDEKGFKRKGNQPTWDRKKKKFVHEDSSKNKKIRTESGVWIPATYKSDLYEKWKKKKRGRLDQDEEDGSENESGGKARFSVGRGRGRGRGNNQRTPDSSTTKGRRGGKPKSELKRPENILKERKRKAAAESYQRHRQDQKRSKGRGGKAGPGFSGGRNFSGGRGGKGRGGMSGRGGKKRR